MLKCSETGREYYDSADGIIDDGEFISWDWINGQMFEQELREYYPNAGSYNEAILNDMIKAAKVYYLLTGRYLQIWGELGELYAEVNFDITRHTPHAQGSDGRLDDDFVEVKTISPEKDKEEVFVKRSGHFNKLLVVKISEDFEFDARMIDRKQLKKGDGKYFKVRWDLMKGNDRSASET